MNFIFIRTLFTIKRKRLGERSRDIQHNLSRTYLATSLFVERSGILDGLLVSPSFSITHSTHSKSVVESVSANVAVISTMDGRRANALPSTLPLRSFSFLWASQRWRTNGLLCAAQPIYKTSDALTRVFEGPCFFAFAGQLSTSAPHDDCDSTRANLRCVSLRESDVSHAQLSLELRRSRLIREKKATPPLLSPVWNCEEASASSNEARGSSKLVVQSEARALPQSYTFRSLRRGDRTGALVRSLGASAAKTSITEIRRCLRDRETHLCKTASDATHVGKLFLCD